METNKKLTLSLIERIHELKHEARNKGIVPTSLFLGADEYAHLADYIQSVPTKATEPGYGPEYIPMLYGLTVYKVDRQKYFNMLTHMLK